MVKLTCVVFFAAILHCANAERVIFPGRGCGTLNPIKYLKEIPEDTTGLSCAIYDPDLIERFPTPGISGNLCCTIFNFYLPTDAYINHM